MMGDMTDPFAEARDLYFRYDGSRFYMSRNDVESDYLRFQVPAELETQWTEELAEHKLSLLDTSPNGGVLHYFWRRGDVRHLDRIIQARPLGTFGARCGFLRDFVNYIDICVPHYRPDDIREALDRALAHAEDLYAEAQDDQTRRYIGSLIEAVRDRQRAD